MPYRDPAARREATSRWRAANPEKVREQHIRYRASHLEAQREYMRDYYRLARAANPERARAADREKYARRADAYRAYRAATEMVVAGERIRITALPDEWKPVARLIQEARREIRESTTK